MPAIRKWTNDPLSIEGCGEARLWGIMCAQVRKPAESGVMMREDYVIRDLIDRAIWDEHFRYKARLYLRASLREAGFGKI